MFKCAVGRTIDDDYWDELKAILIALRAYLLKQDRQEFFSVEGWYDNGNCLALCSHDLAFEGIDLR